jgi:hypothetical protein
VKLTLSQALLARTKLNVTRASLFALTEDLLATLASIHVDPVEVGRHDQA